MGAGDKPKTYTPSYAPILCNVTNKLFAPCTIRRCPEPHVIARYGVGGVCNVSVYICRKCKYKKKDPLCGALECGYENEQGVGGGRAWQTGVT
jgi:hypothetical protein